MSDEAEGPARLHVSLYNILPADVHKKSLFVINLVSPFCDVRDLILIYFSAGRCAYAYVCACVPVYECLSEARPVLQ